MTFLNLLFLPHFLGAPEKRGLLLPRRAAAFWEGPKDLRGGTEKAEAAKLPGAGISPKQCPRKFAAEKGTCRTQYNRRAGATRDPWRELTGFVGECAGGPIS